MNILFIHNNFPAQFRNIAARLAKLPGNRVVAIGSSTARSLPGVEVLRYVLPREDVSSTHPFARRFDVECRRAEQLLYVLSSLAASGFEPDSIVVHPGWGEALPLRAIFRKARIILYCEFYYGVEGRDLRFDPEFPSGGLDGDVGLHLKNAATLLALESCDRGISPTNWQRSTFPHLFQPIIDVVHEGIDTKLVAPDSRVELPLASGKRLTSGMEIITFVVRNLEPLRGYHTFMRALPAILGARPKAEVLIVGGSGTSYGASAPSNTTWKQIFLREVEHDLDLRRVHFLGRVPYRDYLKVLQLSSVHVYLTYPFVLSWSCLEAMSAGCVVIGSETAPVVEVIDGSNGITVPFFDVAQLSGRVIDVLAHPGDYRSMRTAARQYIVENFDTETRCLPKWLSILLDEEGRDGQAASSKPRVWPGRRAASNYTKT
jgi:glycosyltransferase involved in cell wall biosynthesis